MKQSGKRSGFILLDVIAGMTLLAALTTVLLVAAHLRVRTAQYLASQRATAYTAQEVLANLRTTGVSKTTDPIKHTGLQIGNLEWVEVTVSHDGRTQPLFGLARKAPTSQPGGSQ